MPLPFICELGLQTLADQFDKIQHFRDGYLHQPAGLERESAYITVER